MLPAAHESADEPTRDDLSAVQPSAQQTGRASGEVASVELARSADARAEGSRTFRERLRDLGSWVPRPSTGLWIVLAAAIFETVLLSWMQWQNYLSFIPTQGNVGDYNQAFYNTITGHGLFTYTVLEPIGTTSVLGVHFSPTFFALAPIYAIAPAPMTLVVLKTAALAFAAVPLYGLAKVYFRNDVLPVLFACLYLITPLTTLVEWNNVSPEVFVPITLLFALYYFARGRFWPFIVFWILALGTIETTPPLLIVFAAGALIGTFLVRTSGSYWTSAQQRRPLLVALIIAVGWLGLSILTLYMLGPRGGAFGDAYSRRYSVLGASSVPDVVVRAVLHPHLALAAAQFQGSMKLLLLAVVVVGAGIFWIIGGLRYLLPIGALLTLLFLANVPGEYTLGTPYIASITGFLFAGLVEGCALLSDRISGAEPGWRHLAIRAALTEAAASLGERLRTLDEAGRQPSGGRELLASAVRQLAKDNLPAAERDLRKLARRLHVKPATWASIPSVPTHVAPFGHQETGASEPTSTLELVRRRTRRAGWFLLPVAVVVLSIAATFAVSNPLSQPPLAGEAEKWGIQLPSPTDESLDKVLAVIPSGAAVLTVPHLFPELSDRADAYLVPPTLYLPGNETVSEDLNNWVSLSSFVAIDYAVDHTNSEILMTDANLSDFGVYASDDSAVVYERGWQGSAPAVWVPIDDAIAGGSMKSSSATVTDSFATPLGPTLYHAPGLKVGKQIWTGPNSVNLPLGTYSITINLELAAPEAGSELRINATETPATVVETPEYEVPGLTFYSSSVQQSPAGPTTIAQANISSAVPDPSFQPVTITLNVTLPETAYLNLPAVELSTTMSVYLVSVEIAQLSGIA